MTKGAAARMNKEKDSKKNKNAVYEAAAAAGENESKKAKRHQVYEAAGENESKKVKKAKRHQEKPYPKEEHFVFVNNIAKTATEEDLKKVFHLIGGLKYAVIVPKRDRPSSFGFVYFKTREGAKSALGMHNSLLKDKIISVKAGDPSMRKIFWNGGASGSGGPIRSETGRHAQRPY